MYISIFPHAHFIPTKNLFCKFRVSCLYINFIVKVYDGKRAGIVVYKNGVESRTKKIVVCILCIWI